jgi:hypothetical protein
MHSLVTDAGKQAVVATLGTGDFGGKGALGPLHLKDGRPLPGGAAAENQTSNSDSEEMRRSPETFGDRHPLSSCFGGTQGQ